MIKLTELLKELNLDELELRSGGLYVDDTKTYYTFLEDFGLDSDDIDIYGANLDPNMLKKKVLSEDGPYQFIVPSTYTGTLYLVNSAGTDLESYVIGTVDVDIINLSAKKGKPFKITGAEIHLTYVTEQWRGKGLGYKMYTMLLDAYGSVFSDNILYEGSLAMWTKKLAPLGQSGGNFFGIQVSNAIIPLTVEDANDDDVIRDVGVDHFIISTRPPQVLSDIKRKLAGLSLSNGDYGVYEAEKGTTASAVQDAIDNGATFIDELIEEFDFYQVVGKNKDYSTIVVVVDNAMIILHEVGDEVEMQLI